MCVCARVCMPYTHLFKVRGGVIRLRDEALVGSPPLLGNHDIVAIVEESVYLSQYLQPRLQLLQGHL